MELELENCDVVALTTTDNGLHGRRALRWSGVPHPRPRFCPRGGCDQGRHRAKLDQRGLDQDLLDADPDLGSMKDKGDSDPKKGWRSLP